MPTLIGQGLELLIYGMGTVVVFLTVLVYVTRSMSWVVQTYFPITEEPRALPRMATSPASPAPPGQAPTPAQLAAISAALHLHRRRS